MKKSVIILFLFILISCKEEKKYNTGHFIESVQNFEAVNTRFDDYNSTAPFIMHNYLLHFSSNRNSLGADFDIVGENMYMEWSKIDATLDIGTNRYDDRFAYLKPMFDSVNTSCNELGPFSLGYRKEISNSEIIWTDLMMYASDCSGNYDIKFIYSELHNNSVSSSYEIKPVQNIGFLNSAQNDLYPTFFGQDLYNYDLWGTDVSDIEKILFCSDRDGVYNLYEVNLPADSNLIRSLQSTNPVSIKKLSINSANDDKCPFVNGKLMVFTSNREGGYGGFDLYYSVYENGTWSAPVNFGEDINTEYDEYRPITLYYYDFDNNLMIFSSNRPGGKGGFDLYYVGINQMIKKQTVN